MSNNDFYSMLQKHKHSGLVLDTNLLIVFFLGLANQNYFFESRGHNALADYEKIDFDNLNVILDFFEKKFITPHILTEMSNLTNMEKYGDVYEELIAASIVIKERFTEQGVKLSDLLSGFTYEETAKNDLAYYFDYGITDSAIIKIVHQHDILLLTNDFPLSKVVTSMGKSCIYYDAIKYLL